MLVAGVGKKGVGAIGNGQRGREPFEGDIAVAAVALPDGANNRQRARPVTSTAMPNSARRKRGASPLRVKCHHRLLV